MNALHRLLFPGCSHTAEIEAAREQARFWKARFEESDAKVARLERELKAETKTNRSYESELLSRVLTQNGAFGIKPRELPEADHVTKEAGPTPIQPDLPYDQAREEAIDAKTLELEKIYVQRGKTITRPEIRKAVAEKWDYLESDAVEIE